MRRTYPATQAALDHFAAVVQPALDAMCRSSGPTRDLSAFTEARRRAANRVRAAYLEETRDFNTPESVEHMTLDAIRRAMRGTLLGAMVAFLP